jgi:beta-glucanase (GH16 family)
VPVALTSTILGVRFATSADSPSSAADTIQPAVLTASGSFTCETDIEGRCWIPHRLGVAPATASVEVQDVTMLNNGTGEGSPSPVGSPPGTLSPTGAAGTRDTARYLGSPRELRSDRVEMWFRTWDGGPVKRGKLRGSYRVYRTCPPVFGIWCRPPATVAPTAPGIGATASPAATTPAGAPTSAVPTTAATATAAAAPAGSPGGTGPAPTRPAAPSTATAAPTAVPTQPAGGGAPNTGTLLFNDEFDGPAGAAPDSAAWAPTIGANWGVNEIQCYTSSPNNIQLDGNGHLTLAARRESSCGGRGYSSGRVETRDKLSWRYGYFEVRAKMPTGAGMFPAIWMLGPNGVTEWPASGETDIVEVISSRPGRVHTNVHGIDDGGSHWQAGWDGPGRSYDYPGGNLADGYHTYALDWTADALRYYFDGILVRTVTKRDVPVWLWDKPFYLLLNVAVGSHGGDPSAGSFPQEMSVDYVRVYASKPA